MISHFSLKMCCFYKHLSHYFGNNFVPPVVKYSIVNYSKHSLIIKLYVVFILNSYYIHPLLLGS